MINSRAVHGAIKQPWMPEPQPVSIELRVDDKTDVLSMELPSGTKVAFNYNELKSMIEGIESRRASEKESS